MILKIVVFKNRVSHLRGNEQQQQYNNDINNFLVYLHFLLYYTLPLLNKEHFILFFIYVNRKQVVKTCPGPK